MLGFCFVCFLNKEYVCANGAVVLSVVPCGLGTSGVTSFLCLFVGFKQTFCS